MAPGRGHARGLIPDDTLKAAVARWSERGFDSPAEIRPELVGSVAHGQLARRPCRAVDHACLQRRFPRPASSGGQATLALPGTGASARNAGRHHRALPATTRICPHRQAPRGDRAVYPHNPKPTDIAAIVEQAKDHDVISGRSRRLTGKSILLRPCSGWESRWSPSQLRTPFDLAAYPRSATYACTTAPTGPLSTTSALFGDIVPRAPARGHPRPLRTGARDRDMTEPHAPQDSSTSRSTVGGSRLHGRPIEHLGSGTSSSETGVTAFLPTIVSAPYEHVDADRGHWARATPGI